MAKPRAEPKQEPKAKPAVEPKQQPKAIPTAEPKQQLKAKPKSVPKQQPEESAVKRRKVQPKEEPKANPKAQPKGQPKVQQERYQQQNQVEAESSTTTQQRNASALRIIMEPPLKLETLPGGWRDHMTMPWLKFTDIPTVNEDRTVNGNNMLYRLLRYNPPPKEDRKRKKVVVGGGKNRITEEARVKSMPVLAKILGYLDQMEAFKLASTCKSMYILFKNGDFDRWNTVQAQCGPTKCIINMNLYHERNAKIYGPEYTRRIPNGHTDHVENCARCGRATCDVSTYIHTTPKPVSLPVHFLYYPILIYFPTTELHGSPYLQSAHPRHPLHNVALPLPPARPATARAPLQPPATQHMQLPEPLPTFLPSMPLHPHQPWSMVQRHLCPACRGGEGKAMPVGFGLQTDTEAHGQVEGEGEGEGEGARSEPGESQGRRLLSLWYPD